MKFKSIFANKLYSLILPENEEEGIHEFGRMLDLWNDVEYLKKYYDDNKHIIKNNPYLSFITSIQEFVDLVLDEVEELELLFEIHFTKNTFEQFFEYLHKKVTDENKDLRKAKQSVLRIYAIKLKLEQQYIVTGGAIKITDTMQNHPDTEQQLITLKKVQEFIKENNIYDIDSLIGT